MSTHFIYTDASANCRGALLTQEFDQREQPVHYLFHKLTGTQRRELIVVREADAIALQKLDHLPSCYEVDHKPLKYLLASEVKNRKIQMWLLPSLDTVVPLIEYY